VSVYVGELHSDVVTLAQAKPGQAAGGTETPAGPGDHELAGRLAAAMHRKHWLAARVAAEAFDD
jgi:hypothetical protein